MKAQHAFDVRMTTMNEKPESDSTVDLHIVTAAEALAAESGETAATKYDSRGGIVEAALLPVADVGDFVYSEARDLVGVIRATDAQTGAVDIYLGSETLRFYAVGPRLVGPRWDTNSLTYAWEEVLILVDE